MKKINSNTTTVIIATYNGCNYIKDQLNSILAQTHRVNEVLIYDDLSSDNTVQLCQEFIESNKLNNWNLKINKLQLGVFRNFLNGVRAATGDIIFFSDQDDIWCEDKVEKMVNEFTKHPDMLSLTSTFSRFKGEAVLSKHVYHPNSKRNSLSKIEMNSFCLFPYYLGMSMAISKKLLDYFDPDYTPKNITHDIFLNFIAAFNDGLYHFDKVLTKRRSYLESTSNSKSKIEIDSQFNGNIRLHAVFEKIELLILFKTYINSHVKLMNSRIENYIQIIDKNLLINEKRYEYLMNRNIMMWLNGFFHLKYYTSYSTYFMDGVEVLKLKR